MDLPEFDACPMHSTLRASGIGPCGPRALDTSKFSARALDLSYSTQKSKCAFINL